MGLSEKILLLEEKLHFLRKMQIPGLQIPLDALEDFEPSQVSVLVNTLLDASLPRLAQPQGLIEKHKGRFKDREGYPDYDCPTLDLHVELKGHFCERLSPKLKKMISRREPSARFRERIEDIDPGRDALLIVAWKLSASGQVAVPVVEDYLLINSEEAIKARDNSLVRRGGKFAPDGTPLRLKAGKSGNNAEDFELDDNFGKLKRIPHPELARFLSRYS